MPFEVYPEPPFAATPDFAAFLATLSPGGKVVHQTRGRWLTYVQVGVVEAVTARTVTVAGIAIRAGTRDHRVAAVTPEWREWLDAVARQGRIHNALAEVAREIDQTPRFLGNPGAPAHRFPPGALDALDVALRAFMAHGEVL